MMKRILRNLFPLAIILLAASGSAQNLVADSSFEYNNGIPTLLSSIGMNSSWSSPTRGTTDLFCECDKKLKKISEAQVPVNPMGIQRAYTGKCYAGIYAFSHGDYREYLLTQLTSPLSGGVKYELNFHLSLSDYSRVAINRFGACFLKGKVSADNSDVITGLQPVYANIRNEVGTDTIDWHKITIEYIAKGGEQYLLLGSFEVTELDLTGVKVPKGVFTRINQRTERDAYYYIDAVSLHEFIPPYVAKFDTVVIPKIDTLRPMKMDLVIDTNGTKMDAEIVLDKTIVLKNVLFETGAAVLLPGSFPELDATADYLFRTPLVKLEVSGHTDNIGNAGQNLILSEKRAKAVMDYLVSKSIDPGRISHKGYGSTKPISDNNTEEGRKQNRRVELVFSK